MHTGFHRFTEISQTFHDKYIFNMKNLSKLKSRDEKIRRFVGRYPRRIELAKILSEWFRNPGHFLREHAPASHQTLAPSALVLRESINIYPESAPDKHGIKYPPRLVLCLQK